MGLGVPPGPPLVRASINPRTTVLLLAVPNSSKVYLEETSNIKNSCFLPIVYIKLFMQFLNKQDIYKASLHNSLKQYCF